MVKTDAKAPRSAMQSSNSPPYSTVVIYNQSRHASNSVLADIRAVWGDKVLFVEMLKLNLKDRLGILNYLRMFDCL